MNALRRWMTPRRMAVLTAALAPAFVWAWVISRIAPAGTGAPPPAQKQAAPTKEHRLISPATKAILDATALPPGEISRGEVGELQMIRSLEAIPLEEIPAACEALLPLEHHDERTAPLKALLERWLTLDPAAAFTWIIGQASRPSPDSTPWEIVLNACGSTWAAMDGPGLIRWWRETGSRLPGADAEFRGPWKLREHISVSLASWLAQECPSEALGYLASTPDVMRDDGNGRIVYFDSNTAGEFDAGTLVSTPEEIPGALQLMLTCRNTNESWLPVSRQILKKWAALDGADMERWLRENPDYPVAKDAREILALHRLEHSGDPAAAANAWLKDRGGFTEEQVIRKVIESWSPRDLNAAGSWLDSLPRTPQRWEAVEQFAARALTEDPAAAFTWLTTVENPAQRRARVARVFDDWERTQPAQAAAFLQEHPFDAAQMQWIEERRAVR
jgi:hypothetical protein